MGLTKQITITRRLQAGAVPPGYPGYHLYLAKEAIPAMWGGSGEFYLLSQENYANGFNIWMDMDKETERMKSSNGGKINGFLVYVQHPKDVVPVGVFLVKKRLPATRPTEEFNKYSIDRSRYYLYEAEHVFPNGRKNGLCRVFSEVNHVSRDEEIPASETITLRKITQSDGLTYYLHSRDEAAYQERIWRSIRRR